MYREIEKLDLLNVWEFLNCLKECKTKWGNVYSRRRPWNTTHNEHLLLVFVVELQ